MQLCDDGLLLKGTNRKRESLRLLDITTKIGLVFWGWHSSAEQAFQLRYYGDLGEKLRFKLPERESGHEVSVPTMVTGNMTPLSC